MQDGIHSTEVRVTLAGPEQRLLARGKLQLVVTADYLYPSEFVGLLVPKQTCDVYQAVLSEDVESGRAAPNGTAGYALLEVAEDGALKYTIRTEGARRSPLTSFSIEKEARRNRRRIVLQTRERVRFDNGRVCDVDILSLKGLSLLAAFLCCRHWHCAISEMQTSACPSLAPVIFKIVMIFSISEPWHIIGSRERARTGTAIQGKAVLRNFGYGWRDGLARTSTAFGAQRRSRDAR